MLCCYAVVKGIYVCAARKLVWRRLLREGSRRQKEERSIQHREQGSIRTWRETKCLYTWTGHCFSPNDQKNGEALLSGCYCYFKKEGSLPDLCKLTGNVHILEEAAATTCPSLMAPLLPVSISPPSTLGAAFRRNTEPCALSYLGLLSVVISG